MKQVTALCLAFLATTIGVRPVAVNAASQVEPAAALHLTIRIYDHFGVSGRALARAFRETESIYRKIGITVTMMRCRTAVTDAVLDPQCGTIPGPAVIRLNILPEQMAVGSDCHRDKRVVGFAALAPTSDTGVIATVFYDRVEKLARATKIGRGLILGHVVSHELGHLLLGVGGHSKLGIMHIPWTETELKQAKVGRLTFTEEQADLIRRNAYLRLKAARATAVLWQPVLAVAPLAVSAAPRVELDSSRRLTIRIYDYARVPDPVLARAMDETRNVFQRTRIEVRLVRCRVAATDPVLHPCHTEPTGPSVIQVRILPEEMASMAKLDKRVFGFAMTATRPEYGVIANVFYDSVQRLAAENDYPGYEKGVVLGCVLAHEVGHLLLGTGSHSDWGIMHIPWHGPELALAHKGQLLFTREQSATLRRDVAERSIVMRANSPSVVVQTGRQAETSPRPGL